MPTAMAAAMLSPPLLARRWDEGFSTLYTAAYRPVCETLTYHWPGVIDPWPSASRCPTASRSTSTRTGDYASARGRSSNQPMTATNPATIGDAAPNHVTADGSPTWTAATPAPIAGIEIEA